MDELDLSHKDRKYFIDDSVYNCPFCNRRNVRYKVVDSFRFWWNREKKCYGYIVECSDCSQQSLHLSSYNLDRANPYGGFTFPIRQLVPRTHPTSERVVEVPASIKNDDGSSMEIDDAIFYKQPTSFFTIDERIPRVIREPLNEADNCRTSNFRTGGSACLRKAVYELLNHQGITKSNEQGDIVSYDDRIKLLKGRFPQIDPGYFDILKIVKNVTSDSVHEDAWEDFNGAQLKLLVEVTKEILYEIYVEPEERKKRKGVIQKLQEALTDKKRSDVGSKA